MTKREIQRWARKAFDWMNEIPRDKEKNPLTLEGAIRSMILKCPDMIQWRDDALNMMYCTLGAGIDWNKQGRLGDRSPNNYMNPPPAAGGQGVWSREFGMIDSLSQMGANVEMRRRLKARHDAEMAAAIDVVREIDMRVQTYRPKRTRWYPFSWYACNLCVPEKAQQDFFDGAVEMATLIIEADIFDYTSQYWADAMRAQNTAKEIMEVLRVKQKERSRARRTGKAKRRAK